MDAVNVLMDSGLSRRFDLVVWGVVGRGKALYINKMRIFFWKNLFFIFLWYVGVCRVVFLVVGGVLPYRVRASHAVGCFGVNANPRGGTPRRE